MRSLDASTPGIDPVVGVLDYWQQPEQLLR